MPTFETILVPGRKPPYDSWTFILVPPELAVLWGAGPKAVRGTISGMVFRGTASRGEGSLRVPVTRVLCEAAGVRCGDSVEVVLDLDADPRPVAIPDELQAVLRADPDVAALYDALPPAHRRAWAGYVAEAKRPETRLRRAQSAPRGIRAREFPG